MTFCSKTLNDNTICNNNNTRFTEYEYDYIFINFNFNYCRKQCVENRMEKLSNKTSLRFQFRKNFCVNRNGTQKQRNLFSRKSVTV